MRPRISILGRVQRMVCLSVGPRVTRFFFQTPKMSCFLYENHRGSPTLILLNVLGVLGVLNVLNVLNVPHTCASYMCFMCLICPWTHRWPAGPCCYPFSLANFDSRAKKSRLLRFCSKFYELSNPTIMIFFRF